jgi:hypothetical protein
MDSISKGPAEVKVMENKTVAKAKVSRGISLRACVAKAAGWTLEKANSTTSQEASINKTP